MRDPEHEKILEELRNLVLDFVRKDQDKDFKENKAYIKTLLDHKFNAQNIFGLWPSECVEFLKILKKHIADKYKN